LQIYLATSSGGQQQEQDSVTLPINASSATAVSHMRIISPENSLLEKNIAQFCTKADSVTKSCMAIFTKPTIQ
jgi:hypothetical protein